MPENTYAITGSSATLSCVMKAAGAEAKVDWYFKGIQLVKSNLTELHSYDQESSTTTSLRYFLFCETSTFNFLFVLDHLLNRKAGLSDFQVQKLRQHAGNIQGNATQINGPIRQILISELSFFIC